MMPAKFPWNNSNLALIFKCLKTTDSPLQSSFVPMAEKKLDTHRVHISRTTTVMNVAGEQGACFHMQFTCARTDTQ